MCNKYLAIQLRIVQTFPDVGHATLVLNSQKINFIPVECGFISRYLK